VGQVLLYTSDGLGADDDLEITYNLKEGLMAGEFRGSISYYIESPFSTSLRSGLIDTLQVEADIEPQFELSVAPEEGSSVAFRNVKEGEVQEIVVVIEVKSNLAKPYQVTQYLSSQLTTKEGQAIPKGYFKFITLASDEKTGTKAKGTVKVPAKTDVETNETVIFASNHQGEPDAFRVAYELTGPPDQLGGDYTAGIHYSLSQLDIQ
jgi:hypothetical protein